MLDYYYLLPTEQTCARSLYVSLYSNSQPFQINFPFVSFKRINYNTSKRWTKRYKLYSSSKRRFQKTDTVTACGRALHCARMLLLFFHSSGATWNVTIACWSDDVGVTLLRWAIQTVVLLHHQALHRAPYHEKRATERPETRSKPGFKKSWQNVKTGERDGRTDCPFVALW